jgi:ZIP family zinc transporter
VCIVIALLLAVLAAAGFMLASLLGAVGGRLSARARTYAIAIAAGILLIIALGDLFPEALEGAGQAGVAGFVGGFALLFLIEALTHAHTHHAPDEAVQEHALTPFVIGLAIHNLADGFALGIAAAEPDAAAGLVGFSVLIHQVPVGLSLAAVFAADRVKRPTVMRLAVLLGLAIPVATVVTSALPTPGDYANGILTGVASGVLAYLATGHLLPEAQGEAASRLTPVIFVATLVLMLVARLTVLAG